MIGDLAAFKTALVKELEAYAVRLTPSAEANYTNEDYIARCCAEIVREFDTAPFEQ